MSNWRSFIITKKQQRRLGITRQRRRHKKEKAVQRIKLIKAGGAEV